MYYLTLFYKKKSELIGEVYCIDQLKFGYLYNNLIFLKLAVD